VASNRPPCGAEELLAVFGQIDIYLFDQLLRGRIRPHMRVLDAGCGTGRNAVYLMQCGADVFGVDADPLQIQHVRDMASTVAPALPPENFQVARLTALPFSAHYFGAVVCSAVLHFAEDVDTFEGMLSELWRVLAPGGILFSRLASSIGIEGDVVRLQERWYRLPDGSERFLVDEAYLLRIGKHLGAEQLDPIKTTVVQGMRSMTTWVLRKP